MPTKRRSSRAAAAAVLVASCAPFEGAAPPPPPVLDGGGEDGCAEIARAVPNLAFCSDFDGAEPESGWRRADDPEGIFGQSDVSYSPPRAQLLETPATPGSPDARLQREMTGSRFVVAGRLRVEKRDRAGSVVLVRLATADRGGIYFRSDGVLAEVVLTDGGVDRRMDGPRAPAVANGRWTAFRLELDLRARKASLTIDSVEVVRTLAARAFPSEASVVIGPAEPTDAQDGWRVLFDDLHGIAE